MSENTNSKLSLGTKIGYSFGTFGENIAYNFYNLFFMYFLIDYAGVDPLIAGTISLIAVIWSALIDPYIGHLSDNSKNPKGRRRPWIIKFSIPLAIVVFFLFSNVPLTGVAQVLFFTVMNMLFWFILSAVDVPYLVLGAEISRDPRDRLSLRWMSTSFNYLGYAIAGYAILIVSKFEEVFGSTDSAWSITALLMGVLIAGSYLVSYFSTNGNEPIHQVTNEAVKVSIFRSIREGLRIKAYRNVLFYTLFFFIGDTLFTVNQIYLFENVLGAGEGIISTMILAAALMVIFISPVMGKLGAKIGNRNTVLLSTIFITVVFGIFKFIPLTTVSIWGLLLACAIGEAGFFVNSTGMLYEVADVTESETGIKNEGVIIAFSNFVLKLGTALGMWLQGFLLSFYQYEPTRITNTALNGLGDMSTIIPAVFCGISIIFVWRYSLVKKHNSKNHLNVQEAKRLL